MRTVVTIATLIAAPLAHAQQPVDRPAAPAPADTAPLEMREAWCQQYTAWVIQSQPMQSPLPPDVRPTQRFESEFNSCQRNPREYERVTIAELRMLKPPVQLT